MKITRPLALLGGLLLLAVAGIALAVGLNRSAPEPEKGISFEHAQNLGPGSAPPSLVRANQDSNLKLQPFATSVRFFDINRLPTSDATLTTEAVAAHGEASLPAPATPITIANPLNQSARKRRTRRRTETKEGWCYICSRASDEPQWRVHPNPVRILLSTDGPTPFELIATDIRKGRENGATVLLQCVVCSKNELVRNVTAPDRLPSVMGASEVRTLTIAPPMSPSAVIQSVNGASVDSTEMISSPRLAVVEARVRNVPAGARVYIVTQAFDGSTRWVSLLQPQNSLAGDRFVGTAVFGKNGNSARDNFQKYWLSVVMSHQPFKNVRVGDNGESKPILESDWEDQYAPMLQVVSESPVMVKRIPQEDGARITLNVEGAEPGYGSINGSPIPVERYCSVFGQIDFPAGLSDRQMSKYRAWVLIFRAEEFGEVATGQTGTSSSDRVSAGGAKGAIFKEEAHIAQADWTLPWAALSQPGRYILLSVLTEGVDTAPSYISDPSVRAVSQPRLVVWQKQVSP